jgi:hypothetical protein
MLGSILTVMTLCSIPLGLPAWVGVLITSFNLFPVGQWTAVILPMPSRPTLAAAFPTCFGPFFCYGYFSLGRLDCLGALILVLGLKHPQVAGRSREVGLGRQALGWLALAIFLLSFIPDPIKGFSLFDLLGGISGR